jgi:ABC-type glycerol-3-phosphate transport system permease component
MVTILPLLVLYALGQRLFTQSIDRTGITGE